MPISQPVQLTNLGPQQWEMLITTLGYLLNDIYEKLDRALNLGNQGDILPLDKGGLGADVSGFSGLLAVFNGEVVDVSIGAGLTLTGSEVLTALAALPLPVGSVYWNAADEDPATALGFGTWTQIGQVDFGSETVYGWKRTA